MKKIIILDFSTTKVHVFLYDENVWDNTEDFFDSDYCIEKGIKETNCQYMVVDDLNIQIH
jgi:hypothetical protein